MAQRNMVCSQVIMALYEYILHTPPYSVDDASLEVTIN